jgi:ParB family chromosome partitioning protein
MNAVSSAAVVQVPIQSVVIGQRRREKLGRLQVLANSIKTHGLIHPILLRGDTLVAGHRRLEACRSLNWKTIPARRIDRMTDEELRAVELEENTAREALSDYATSKARLAQIRQAEADIKARATVAKADLPPSSGAKSAPRGRGRPKRDSPSREAIAAETGIGKTAQVEIERHVALAERYPFMQRSGWSRHHVLDAGDQMERVPDEDQSSIAALLDQDGIPPEKAIELLTHAGGALWKWRQPRMTLCVGRP